MNIIPLPPPPKNKTCALCDEPIKPGEPTVPDTCGEKGARLHIDCAAKDQDGCDLDREMGDS